MLEDYTVLKFFLVPTDLKEIKLEKNDRKASVSLNMVQGNSSELIAYFWPVFADFQNKVFSLNLNISSKYEPH